MGDKITYRDVKADVLGKITGGIWRPGDHVPSEVELAENYDCARATVNRAMRELAEDGILERRRKAGTRVRVAPLRQATFSIPIIRQEIERKGAIYSYTLLNREVHEAPDWLRARMKLNDAAKVLHLTCRHLADDLIYQHEDRWINLCALPQAESADFAATSPNEWLVATVPFTEVEIGFSAVSANKDLARHLKCAEGDALFMADRATWLNDNAITFVRLVFQRGYRMATRY